MLRMWYSSPMTDLSALVGKPLTFYAKGKKRTIGAIIDAQIVDNSVRFTATVTDGEVADLLGVSPPTQISGSVDVSSA
jgi:hypothetical protein